MVPRNQEGLLMKTSEQPITQKQVLIMVGGLLLLLAVIIAILVRSNMKDKTEYNVASDQDPRISLEEGLDKLEYNTTSFVDIADGDMAKVAEVICSDLESQEDPGDFYEEVAKVSTQDGFGNDDAVYLVQFAESVSCPQYISQQ